MLHFECSKQISKNELITNAGDFILEIFRDYDKKLSMNEITKKRFIFLYKGVKIKVGIAGYISTNALVVIADDVIFNKVFRKIQVEYGFKKKISRIFISYMIDVFCEKFLYLSLKIFRGI